MPKRSDRRIPRTESRKADGSPPPRQTTAADVNAELRKLLEVVRAGEPIEKHFTVRTTRLAIKPTQYSPAAIKAVRESLNASQALLAMFLGVSTRAVAQWEQGQRKPPLMACRYLDDIQEFPELWTKRLKSAGVAQGT